MTVTSNSLSAKSLYLTGLETIRPDMGTRKHIYVGWPLGGEQRCHEGCELYRTDYRSVICVCKILLSCSAHSSHLGAWKFASSATADEARDHESVSICSLNCPGIFSITRLPHASRLYNDCDWRSDYKKPCHSPDLP
jgi:hypothetical protein